MEMVQSPNCKDMLQRTCTLHAWYWWTEHKLIKKDTSKKRLLQDSCSKQKVTSRHGHNRNIENQAANSQHLAWVKRSIQDQHLITYGCHYLVKVSSRPSRWGDPRTGLWFSKDFTSSDIFDQRMSASVSGEPWKTAVRAFKDCVTKWGVWEVRSFSRYLKIVCAMSGNPDIHLLPACPSRVTLIRKTWATRPFTADATNKLESVSRLNITSVSPTVRKKRYNCKHYI